MEPTAMFVLRIGSVLLAINAMQAMPQLRAQVRWRMRNANVRDEWMAGLMVCLCL